MKTRILAALVGMPLVLAAVFAAPPALFGALVLLAALLALHEYLRLCAVEAPLAATALLALAGLLAAVRANVVPGAVAAALPALALVSLWRVGDPARRFRELGESVLGLGYIGYAMGCLWLLRESTANGPAWVLLVLAATWAGDSAAYFVGTRFGRRKLAPTLSPHKTWAGAVGGLAGSLGGGCAALPLLGGAPALLPVVAASLAVGVAGQLGDLFESLWKRAKGVKDSGTLIPGHGGLLDRIDSLLLAIPVCLQIARGFGQ